MKIYKNMYVLNNMGLIYKAVSSNFINNNNGKIELCGGYIYPCIMNKLKTEQLFNEEFKKENIIKANYDILKILKIKDSEMYCIYNIKKELYK